MLDSDHRVAGLNPIKGRVVVFGTRQSSISSFQQGTALHVGTTVSVYDKHT